MPYKCQSDIVHKTWTIKFFLNKRFCIFELLACLNQNKTVCPPDVTEPSGIFENETIYNNLEQKAI